MLIEEQSPGYLDNYDSVRRLIKEGDFKDGTNLGSISPQDRRYTNCPIGEEDGVTEDL